MSQICFYHIDLAKNLRYSVDAYGTVQDAEIQRMVEQFAHHYSDFFASVTVSC